MQGSCKSMLAVCFFFFIAALFKRNDLLEISDILAEF